MPFFQNGRDEMLKINALSVSFSTLNPPDLANLAFIKLLIV